MQQSALKAPPPTTLLPTLQPCGLHSQHQPAPPHPTTSCLPANTSQPRHIMLALARPAPPRHACPPTPASHATPCHARPRPHAAACQPHHPS
ncbi:hypothetical protein ACOMHN_032799 [Nucella lapillus]